MQITRLIYREQQTSLLNEERGEVRAVMAVTHNGESGLLRVDTYYEKRDSDSTYYCDCPGVTADTIAEGDGCDVDERVWGMTPEHTKETPEIKAMIIALIDHELHSDC